MIFCSAAAHAALYRVSITFRTVKGNHRYMKDRVLSGVTLVAFFMAIVVFNRSFPLALNIAIAFISALAVLKSSRRWNFPTAGISRFPA